MTRVTLYGKPGCHLCDEARAVVEAVRADVGFELEEVDITLDPVLATRYGERIPVVEIDGEEAFEYFVDAGELRRRSVWFRRELPRARRPALGADRRQAPSGSRWGVAARLSRYLQVLTQAKKMGRETISSQELADYTHVNSTQIRRDLSGFGKFGKRGVGYNVESLRLADPQDPAQQRPAQHRPVRGRPPRAGDRRLRHVRRPRLPRSWRCSTPTRAVGTR